MRNSQMVCVVASVALAITGMSATAQDRPVDLSGDWWSDARQQIVDSEYHVTWQEQPARDGVEGSWQAPNRAGGFRTVFLNDGIRVVPRATEGPAWQFGLSLAAIGREDALGEISAPLDIDVADSRIEIDRDTLVEWYVNGRDGLEQGFTLLERPGSPDSGGPVHIELALSGSLVPRFRNDGQTIDLVSATDGIVLRYAKLVVTDATGAQLPARLESFTKKGSGGIRIVFDDAYATYPVVVDPLITSWSWIAEGNQVNAEFGFAVATAGDVDGDGFSDVIVGARFYDNGEFDEGCSFVYRGSVTGLSAVSAWQFDSNQVSADLGYSVQTAGDVNRDGYSDVVVGCPKCGTDSAVEGKAFVFHGSSLGLSSTPAWTGTGDVDGMDYGFSVAAAGDVNGDGWGDVLVGAPLRDIMGSEDGRAYLYYGSGSGIGGGVETIDGLDPGDRLGYAVAGAGDLNSDGFADFVLGVPGGDLTFIDQGEISIWLGAATGPSHMTSLGPIDQFKVQFGESVAAAGDVNGDGYADLIAGAPEYDGPSAAVEGRVYVYYGNSGGVDFANPWSLSGGRALMRFGHSVGTAGDVNGDGYADIIVGAPDWDNVESFEGGAFVYLGTAAGLQTAPAWVGESNMVSAKYGISVGTAGDVNGDGYSDVIVGATLVDAGHNNEGRAYAYLGSAAGLSPAPSWSGFGNSAFEQHGFSVASAGDVNGDGYADVIVGVPRYDAGSFDEGNARVYHGSPDGPLPAFAWDTSGSSAFDHLGQAVASAGDVNGDGYSDVIIGIPAYDVSPKLDVGRVEVFHGSPTGLTGPAAWFTNGTQGLAELGAAVAPAGDVNGDGYGDVVIGEPQYDLGALANHGRALVYYGSSSGLTTTDFWSDVGDPSGSFGYSVASAGDVNGDGLSDVIVGEPGLCPACGTGEAFVYLGTKAGLAGTPSWFDDGGPVADNRFGWSVGSAGDLNGDGYADIVVGNILDASFNHVNVYYGSSSGPSVPADWQAPGQSNTSEMGHSVGTVGDVNGDGFADLFAGEPGFDGAGSTDEGRILVWHGSDSGLATLLSSEIRGFEAFAQLGFSVAGAGDTDGDGYADMIAGAPRAQTLGQDTGKSFVYSGNGAEGTSVELLPRQMRADGSGPLHQLGESDDAATFGLRLFARTPFGRGDVRMQSEVKELGTLLDGSGVTTPTAFTDSGGAAFVTLNESQSGLVTGEEYHWRLRLDYDPVTLPFAPASRWMTMPWNGWQEMDLRTNDGAVLGAGAVPDDAASQLRLGSDGAGEILLEWGGSCTATDDDFAIYTGTIGCFASHVVETCSTDGATSHSVPDGACEASQPPEYCQPGDVGQAPDPCRQYFLVVPVNTTDRREGSIGFDSRGLPRSPGRESCYAQELAACAGTAP